MCRLLAYVGPPVAASTVVLDPPHSLLTQCTAARLQTSGCENPDGWGIGWYTPDRVEPHRYRTTQPLTADEAGRRDLATIVSGRFLAHIRHKSPGSPTEEAGNAPFVEGRWMFAHNGFVEGYRQGRREELRAEVSPARRRALSGDADSEVLFALVLDRLDAGDAPLHAVRNVVESIGEGRYNMVLTDGTQLVACRWDNSLYVRRDDPVAGALVIASEPYDDEPGWHPVPDRSFLGMDDTGLTITPPGSPFDATTVEALP